MQFWNISAKYFKFEEKKKMSFWILGKTEALYTSVCASTAHNTKCFCLNSYFQAGTHIFQWVQPGQISCFFPQSCIIYFPTLLNLHGCTTLWPLSLARGKHSACKGKSILSSVFMYELLLMCTLELSWCSLCLSLIPSTPWALPAPLNSQSCFQRDAL